jgi:PleD family two-component response regulator
VDLTPCLGERRITVSIGVTAAMAGDTVSSVLRRADAALYAAKHAGRNCVRTDLAVSVDTTVAWGATHSA